jgi:hypothetical protein
MPYEVDWDEPKRLSNIKSGAGGFRDAAPDFLKGLFLCKEDRREDYRA